MSAKSAEAVARELWAEMESMVQPYATGVVPVPELIERTAFFPGGLGLWIEKGAFLTEFPTRQIMVVGQDFNTLAKYEAARVLKSEVSSSPTWQNLQRVFARCGPVGRRQAGFQARATPHLPIGASTFSSDR